MKTKIKKASIPLSEADGHIFTAQLQGMTDYEIADPKKDFGYTRKRTSFEFNFENQEPESIKILGHWYSLNSLVNRFEGSFSNVVGPIVPCMTGKKKYVGVLIQNPYIKSKEKYLLMIICEAIPRLVKDSKSALTFIGGFDLPDIANNTKIATKFLALSYPVNDFTDLEKRIGSIDYKREKNERTRT